MTETQVTQANDAPAIVVTPPDNGNKKSRLVNIIIIKGDVHKCLHGYINTVYNFSQTLNCLVIFT